ncbi:phosphate ABC transporter substrate-binding protein [Enterococcus canis]|uniref:Phosphate ABC transporter substrate-binding protein n=1 Tax=Enterococcus canis TaxID=214095 RepID=A0A1L8RKP8_9ENTE|nr:TIGR03943 family protein [Enterococcus canis]OJG20327.1 phosphate ABC transporter substrate-binding protein [Enterococcus canis]
MIRFFILAGYVELMMYLQSSGKLDQYINVHYRYLAILSMILAFVLALVQLIQWVRNDHGEHDHEHAHHEGHHHHTPKKGWQKILGYGVIAVPLLVGLLFPTVSLDTTIVEAKGFQFPVSKESVGDPEMQTQYLKPDTSMYFNKDDYKTQMDEAMSHYQGDTLEITDSNYLEVMELIYNYPSEFMGKKIRYTGFIYKAQQEARTDLFAFRFGIIHCVADSGVFGLLIQPPKSMDFNDNDWVQLEGTLAMNYYEPFKRQIPVVQVTNVTPVAAPANQYVYRSF